MKDRLLDDPCIDVPLPEKPDLCKTFGDVLSAREVDQLVEAIRDRTPGYGGLNTHDRYEALVFMAPGSDRGGTRPSDCGGAS